jgi:Tol biopolymer transport system component
MLAVVLVLVVGTIRLVDSNAKQCLFQRGEFASIKSRVHRPVTGASSTCEPVTVSVVPGSEQMFSPHWSPDGRYIAAMSGDSQKIMLFDFKTEEWTELAGITSAYPNWSRDGNYIYFHTFGSDHRFTACG